MKCEFLRIYKNEITREGILYCTKQFGVCKYVGRKINPILLPVLGKLYVSCDLEDSVEE